MGIRQAGEMSTREAHWSRARTRTALGRDSDSHVSWLDQSRILSRASWRPVRQADSASHVALWLGNARAPARGEDTLHNKGRGRGEVATGDGRAEKPKASRSRIRSTKGNGDPFSLRRLVTALMRFRFRQYMHISIPLPPVHLRHEQVKRRYQTFVVEPSTASSLNRCTNCSVCGHSGTLP